MKIRALPLAVCAFLFSTAAFAGNWVYDPSTYTISDGDWKFSASANKTALTVGQPVEAECPTSVTPLDFSKPVVKSGDESVVYTIVTLNTAFTRWAKIDNVSANYTYDCAQYVGAFTLPGEGLTTVGNKAFCGCVNLSGDLVFPSTITSVSTGAFCGTRVTSAIFPAASFTLDGGYDFGVFEDCTQLTNAVFSAGGAFSFTSGFNFKGCTALKELDLSGASSFSLTANRDQGGYAHINGCTSLTNVIFGSGVAFNVTNVFNNCPALATVRFHGAPPSVLTGRWLTGVSNSQKVTTIIDDDQVDAWAEYAEDGTINPEDSTWAAEYVANGIDLSKRLLVCYIDPLAKRPRINSVEPSDVWTNSVKVAVSGVDLLGGTVTITLDDGINDPVVRQFNDYGTFEIKPLLPATHYSVSATAENGNGSDSNSFASGITTYGITNLAARAVFSDEDSVLTFYYDSVDRTTVGTVVDLGPNGERTWGTPNGGDWVNDDTVATVVFDPSFKEYQPTTCASWFCRFRLNNKGFVSFSGMENLDTSRVTSMSRMFYNCRTSGCDMTHFVTKRVTSFSQMFGYSGWDVMDFSSFDTRAATDMYQMFVGCGSISTIYANERFVTDGVTSSSGMFTNCKKPLVGGAGTTWTSENPTDKTYARVDGGTECPGYFTYKAPPKGEGLVIIVK